MEIDSEELLENTPPFITEQAKQVYLLLSLMSPESSLEYKVPLASLTSELGADTPSEEEVDLGEWKGFFSVNEIDNLMPEVDRGTVGLPFHHHAGRRSSGTPLALHVAMQGVFKELTALVLGRSPDRELQFCSAPDGGEIPEASSRFEIQLERIKTMIIGSVYILNDVGFILPPNGELPIQVGDGKGKYVFVFQMLDGENNLDSGSPAGVTYGILMKPGMAALGRLHVAGLKGNSMLGAGYLVLSTAAVFVCAFEHKRGAHEYTWDKSLGEFLLTTEDICIPRHGTIYSVEHAVTLGWNDATKAMLTRMRNPRVQFGREGKTYYVGCPTAEHHFCNMEGGLFLAPAGNAHPSGSLLLIHQCWPLAYVTREAGGYASDGRGSVFEVPPTHLRTKSPYFGGSRDDVLELVHFNRFAEANQIDSRQTKLRSMRNIPEFPWTFQRFDEEHIQY